MRFLWLTALAFVVIVGGLVVIGCMRWVVPVLLKLRKLPRDPGFPRAPQGAPYRGPH